VPLKFTGGLGGALAGRPIMIRYVDNRRSGQAVGDAISVVIALSSGHLFPGGERSDRIVRCDPGEGNIRESERVDSPLTRSLRCAPAFDLSPAGEVWTSHSQLEHLPHEIAYRNPRGRGRFGVAGDMRIELDAIVLAS